jgi:uncharacterized protein (DUF1778 family)
MQTQPADDIESVMGRFQAWSGVSEAKPGIRELSSEEALQSSRYRWQGGNRAAAKKETLAEAAPTPPKSQPVASDPKPVRPKTARVAKEAQRGAAKKAHGKHTAKKKAAGAPRAKKPNVEFREVLATAIQPAAIVVPSRQAEMTRQHPVSVRLAPRERALIQAHAAAAGISVSAYIRECALEVEQLRVQIHQTVAALEHKGVVAVQARASAAAPAPGLFMRLARKLFARRPLDSHFGRNASSLAVKV